MENSRDWTTRYVKSWGYWYAYLAGKPGIHGLEIGSAVGRTSEWLARNVLTGDGARLDCVDPWAKIPTDEEQFDLRTIGLPIRKLKGRSDELLPKLKSGGAEYHLVYVDGSHYAQVVLFDLVLAWSMLVPGGILVADDYRHTSRKYRWPPGVAVDAWMACSMDSIAGYEISKLGQMAVWKIGKVG